MRYFAALLLTALGMSGACAQSLTVTEADHVLPTINSDGSYNFTCTLNMKRYWDEDYTGPRRALLHIEGAAWGPVEPIAADTDLVEDFVAAGYVVFSPQIRGIDPGATGCDVADRAQQARDVEAAFTGVLFDSWYFDLASYGVTLSGISAGGHRVMYFSRMTSAANQAKIRAVVTIDSPISFWHFWANNRGFYTPSHFEDRDITLPLAGEDRLVVPLPAASRYLNLRIQGYFTDGVFDGVDCNAWFQEGPDCYAAPNPDWSFIIDNTPFSNEAAYPPVLMVTVPEDPVVQPDSVLGACVGFTSGAGVSFVSDDATRYVADCGTHGERFILRKGGSHAVGFGPVIPDMLSWIDAQPHP